MTDADFDNFVTQNYRSTITINGGTHTTNWLNIQSVNVRMNIPGHSSWRYIIPENRVTLNDGTLKVNGSTDIYGVYTQTGGTAFLGKVNLRSDQNSRIIRRNDVTINFSKASLTIDAINSNGSLQSYNQSGRTAYIGSYSGAGKINISNGILTIGTLNSGSQVTATGGTIITSNIDLTSKTLSGTNTKLETQVEEVGSLTTVSKQVEKINIVDNGNDNAQGLLDGSVLGTTQNFGGLYSSFRDNVSWSGGEMRFTGTYAQSVADAVTTAIQSAFGSNVKVSFENIVEDAPELGNGLNTATINKLMQATGSQELILYTTVWDGSNQQQVVGLTVSNTSIGQTIGFKVLKNDVGTTVNSGKTLVLLGENAATQIAKAGFTVDGATLRLGTASNSVSKGGKITTVILKNNGQFIAQGGQFRAQSVTGDGSVNVRESSANLTLDSLNIEGDFNSEGTFETANAAMIGGGSHSGTGTFGNDLTINKAFTNTGVLSVDGALTFGENGHFTQTAGSLTTIQDNLFENVNFSEIDPLNTIKLGQSVPQDIKETMTELFQKYVPGNVVESIAQHATFNGGKVIVSGVNLTETMVDDLTRAFKETFAVTKYQETIPFLPLFSAYLQYSRLV